MTEQEWLACVDLAPMFAFLRSKARERKLRLFFCALFQSLHPGYGGPQSEWLPSPSPDDAIREVARWQGLTDRCAEGIALPEEWAEMQRAIHFEETQTNEISWVPLFGGILCPAEGIEQLSELNQCMFLLGKSAWTTNATEAHLLRHIIGNPFQPSQPPPSWPATVISLAQSLDDQESVHFALHDALLDAGYPDLAEHFKESYHPKGCWALDVILGKK